jgi:biopolymer transport protein ExbD
VGERPIGLNVSTMIDVVFLLLIYFLLIAEFSPREEAFDVSIAEARAAERADPFELPTRPVRVRVRSFGDGAGEYAISTDSPVLRDSTSYEALYEQVGTRRGGVFPPDQTFVIDAAESTRWEHVMGVFNALRRAEYDRIRFAPPTTADGGSS